MFRLLDQDRRYPVTWITGPPGSGKTTLVASYLDVKKLPCLWYQMDEGDSDIASFFYYMGLAVKKAAPRTKQPLPFLTPEYQFGIPAFAKRYFENLYSRLKPPSVIVFDNYQEVPADSPFHEMIQKGLSEIPRGIKVIVVSRSEPPTIFVRLEANKIMNVIGWEQLRLTSEETSGMMKLRTGKPVSQESLQKLYEKISGWAAGVVLMEASQTRGGGQIEPEAMVPGKVSDYFAGEVFSKIDKEMHDFLLKTAYLPRMTPHMAEAITGNSRAGRILMDLNRRNSFTERSAERGPVYQYHAMFREFLRKRAEQEYSEVARSQLQLAAAKLLEESGQIENAAELFIEARDWDGLIRLVLNHAQSLASQGRNRTLEGWLSRIPQDITEADPWLLYWMALSLLHYRPNDSTPLFERAYKLFDETDNAAGVFLSWSGVVDSILLQFERFGRFDRWFDELQQALKKYKGIPSLEIESLVTLSMFSALDLRMPHHRDAMKWRERMMALAKRNGDVNLEAIAAFHAAWHELYIGHPKRSALFLQPVEKHMRSNQLTPLVRLMILMLSSLYCWIQGRNEECQKLVSEALRLADESGVHILDHQTLGSAITSALSVGDIERAQGLLQRMEGDTAAMGRAFYYYLASWHAVARHDLAAALEFATAGLEFAERIEAPFHMAVNALGAAVIHHELKNRDASVRLYRRAWQTAREMNSPALLVMCNIAAAQFAFDLKKESEGRNVLRNAMAIGREQGYLNMYWWRSDVMSRLCEKALEHGIEADYVRDLIRKRNLVPDEPPLHIDAWPWPIRINTLGRFEILKDGKPLRFSGKVQKKPLEMLKALIAFGGKEVPAEQIAEALWPDANGDAAYKAFGTTLIRLRELLGVKDAVHLSEGNVTLDQRYFWIDTWAFEKMLESAECGVRSEKNPKNKSAIGNRQSEVNLSLIEKALELYKGPFLGAESATWAISLRERLRDKFLRCTSTSGMYWEQNKAWDKAIDCYKKGLEADDLIEEFYRRIIICHQRLGRNAEALSAYNRCKKTLASYGIELSSETKALLRKD